MGFSSYDFNSSHLRINGDNEETIRRLNYDICCAIDLTKLRIVLEKMEGMGMPNEQHLIFYGMADALRQLIRTENYRIADNLSTDGKTNG